VLFAGWGIAGLIDQPNVPFDGLGTGPDNTVIRVREASPAAAAGLSVGDRLVRINGVSVEDTPALARMARPAIGETRAVVVEDAATSVSRDVSVTYAPQPARDRMLAWAGFLIGLCYIGFGLFAYSRSPGQASMLLALTGLCLGLTFFGGPYIASHAIRSLVQAIALMVIVMGFATLLHTLAVFPKRTAMLEPSWATVVLYAPAVLIASLFVWLIVFEPASTSSLNLLVNALVGIFIVGYFGVSLVALVHSWTKATALDRERQGLNLLLAGVLVGLAPVTIASLVGIFAPSVVLPGSDFYALTLVLVPITLALAVMRVAPEPAIRPAPVSFAGARGR
jgi:hypothetical protein